MIERKIEWPFFRKQYARLAYLPGYERVAEEHWAEWFRIFSSGFYPHELAWSIDYFVMSGRTEFFPGPGKVHERIMEHRRRTGGNSWDETVPLLEEQAQRWASGELTERPYELLAPPAFREND